MRPNHFHVALLGALVSGLAGCGGGEAAQPACPLQAQPNSVDAYAEIVVGASSFELAGTFDGAVVTEPSGAPVIDVQFGMDRAQCLSDATCASTPYDAVLSCPHITLADLGKSRSFGQACTSPTLMLYSIATDPQGKPLTALTVDLSSAPGIVTGASSLEADGTGTVTVDIEVPSTTLVAANAAGVSVQVAMPDLQGALAFTRQCPAQGTGSYGGGWGGCF